MMTHSGASQKQKPRANTHISQFFKQISELRDSVLLVGGKKKTPPKTHFHNHIYNAAILMATKS
jgi:hypothetical protein